jgi:hypothetical protein
MTQALTGYGLAVFQKQMQAGANYSARTFSLSSMEDGFGFPHPPMDAFLDLDPDIFDHPRVLTVAELRAAIPEQDTVQIFKVSLLHTVTNKPTNPQFVILYDKIEGRECFQEHTCTCGSTVRCGVPCRHFWAVVRSSTVATFHSGLINDLWFKRSQTLGENIQKLYTYDDPMNPLMDVCIERLIYPDPFLPQADANMQELTASLSKKRLWGAMLGEAKKAIEKAIETNAYEGLYQILQGYSNATLSDHVVSNNVLPAGVRIVDPATVRGKGRPKGSKNKGQPKPKRTPLCPFINGVQTVQTVCQGMIVTEGEVAQMPVESMRKRRKCGVCNELTFHDARTCPARKVL